MTSNARFFKVNIMTRVGQAVFLSMLLAAAVSAAPAPTTGSLRGKIYDPRGYIISGVTVFARNQATGEEFKAIANELAED